MNIINCAGCAYTEKKKEAQKKIKVTGKKKANPMISVYVENIMENGNMCLEKALMLIGIDLEEYEASKAVGKTRGSSK